MIRAGLAIGLLALLAVTTGCLGPGEVDREALGEEASYEWNTTAAATITVDRSSYAAVYRIENRSSIDLYRFHRLNNERPLDPVAVQFRYPNGTLVGPESMTFEKTRTRTTVTLPASNGTLAFTAPKTGKGFRVPAVIDGSYEVVLPPDARVGVFLLGRVSPDGYQTFREGDQVRLRWEQVDGNRITVRYYLVRDILLFGSLAGVGVIVLVIGVSYFWFQLRSLKERRQQVQWERD